MRFFDLAKNLADLVFDGVGAGGALLEAVKVGEELTVDELLMIDADHLKSLLINRRGRRATQSQIIIKQISAELCALSG